MVIFEWLLFLVVVSRFYVTGTVWDSFGFLMAVVSGTGYYVLVTYHGIHYVPIVVPVVLGLVVWDLLCTCTCGWIKLLKLTRSQKK